MRMRVGILFYPRTSHRVYTQPLTLAPQGKANPGLKDFTSVVSEPLVLYVQHMGTDARDVHWPFCNLIGDLIFEI